MRLFQRFADKLPLIPPRDVSILEEVYDDADYCDGRHLFLPVAIWTLRVRNDGNLLPGLRSYIKENDPINVLYSYLL